MSARINPHPSGDPRYDVIVLGPGGPGMVRVTYASRMTPPWEVLESVPDEWQRLTEPTLASSAECGCGVPNGRPCPHCDGPL